MPTYFCDNPRKEVNTMDPRNFTKYSDDISRACSITRTKVYYDRSYKPEIEDKLMSIKEGWISKWKRITPFTANITVSWAGFHSTTEQLINCGWTVDLEYNGFTKSSKLVLKHKEQGLMRRIPFNAAAPWVDIDTLYAVNNYKMKAPKLTETELDLTNLFTKDDVGTLLALARELDVENARPLILKQHRKAIKDKVIDFISYMEKRKAA